MEGGFHGILSIRSLKHFIVHIHAGTRGEISHGMFEAYSGLAALSASNCYQILHIIHGAAKDAGNGIVANYIERKGRNYGYERTGKL
jgi:hypothetical protein